MEDGKVDLYGCCSPYSTYSIQYTEKAYDCLVQLGEYNILNNKDLIMQALHTAVAQKRQKKTWCQTREDAFSSLNLPRDWRSLTISQQSSKDSCSIPLNGNLRWTMKWQKWNLFLQRISLQQLIAIQLQQWSTSHCVVQRMGSHKEGAKMIVSMVPVALRRSLKCLSLTCSGQSTLKAYFVNSACVLCLQGGGEASSSLLARFVVGTMVHCKQVFRERKVHGIWHPLGTDHLWGRFQSEAEEAQDIGARSTRKAKEWWWNPPLLDCQILLWVSSLLLGYPSLFSPLVWAVIV